MREKNERGENKGDAQSVNGRSSERCTEEKAKQNNNKKQSKQTNKKTTKAKIQKLNKQTTNTI